MHGSLRVNYGHDSLNLQIFELVYIVVILYRISGDLFQ